MPHGKPFHSLNPTLNALRINKLAAEFITVSPTTGAGDYSTIFDALDAGHPFIFVKEGTYNETNDLVLNGQTLIGESPKTTIINLVDNNIEFEDYDATDSYLTGTAQLVNNSTTVNGGGGTLWDTGGNAPSSFSDPWLIVNGMALPIANVVNDTTLTLKEQYRGDTQTGNYHIIDAKNIGSTFTGFTVIHTPTGGLDMMRISGIGVNVNNNVFQCDRLNTSRVIAVGPDDGAGGAFSVGANINIQNNKFLSGAIAIELQSAESCVISDNSFQNQNDHIIRTETSLSNSGYHSIINNKFFGCTNAAIELEAGSTNMIIQGNVFDVCRSYNIDMDDSNFALIQNNHFDGVTTQDVIRMQNTCMYCNVSNNYSEPNDWTLSCKFCKIENNMFNIGLIDITGDNNTVNGNSFEQGKISITGNHTTVNNNVFEDGDADDVILLNGESCTANGNIIEDADGYGITLDGAGSHTCNNNTINSTGDMSIRIDAPNCTVANNTIKDSGADGIRTALSYLNSVITGNRITNPAETGIRYIGADSNISNNNISTPGSHGIFIDDTGVGQGDDIIISNNYIETPTGSGIYVESSTGGVKIDDNLIKTPSVNGITIDSTGAHQLSVNGNTILTPGALGIILDAGGETSIISNNVIRTPVGIGIHLSSGESDLHATINGNTIKSGGAAGIFLDREGEVTGDENDYCIVSDNNIHDSTGDGIECETRRCIIANNRCDDGSANGITIRNGDETIVEGNGCNNNSANGIEIENTADRIIITSNICLNNTTNEILNNGTNTVAANNIVA